MADGADDPAAEMTKVPDWAVGYAFPVPGTVPGVSEYLRPRDAPGGDWEPIPSKMEHQRMVCSCGAAHHSTVVDRTFDLGELMDAAKRLSAAADDLLNRGKEHHDWMHHKDILLNEVRRIKTDPDDHTPDRLVLIQGLAESIKQHSGNSDA